VRAVHPWVLKRSLSRWVRDREGEGGGGGGSEEVELENLGLKGKEKGWRDNRGVKEDNSGVFEVVERVRRVREGIRDVEKGIVRFKVEWINRLVLSGVVALVFTSVDSIVLQWVGVKSREPKREANLFGLSLFPITRFCLTLLWR